MVHHALGGRLVRESSALVATGDETIDDDDDETVYVYALIDAERRSSAVAGTAPIRRSTAPLRVRGARRLHEIVE